MNLPVIAPLTIYYDGNCPMCSTEMARLLNGDKAARLRFIDITAPGFDPTLLGVTLTDLNHSLHSQTADGRLLTGLDSIVAAYTLAGKGWFVLPLRIRFLRPILTDLYHRFARNRHRFSGWLGYRHARGCKDGTCHLGRFFLKP